MQIINDNFKEVLSNGEPRSVLDEECRQVGIPNIPEYVDAIEAYGEKRLLILSAAAMHLLTDRKLDKLEPGTLRENVKRFKRYLESITGKWGELKMFKPKIK
jgi:hypothetical protein